MAHLHRSTHCWGKVKSSTRVRTLRKKIWCAIDVADARSELRGVVEIALQLRMFN